MNMYTSIANHLPFILTAPMAIHPARVRKYQVSVDRQAMQQDNHWLLDPPDTK